MHPEPTENPGTPAPLTEAEARKLWLWERAMVRLAAMAIMVLAIALGAAHLYGEIPGMRAVVLGLAILLMLGVVVMQFRERCPRCGSRLARGLAVLLPHRCPCCGVAFPRPLDVEGELDN